MKSLVSADQLIIDDACCMMQICYKLSVFRKPHDKYVPFFITKGLLMKYFYSDDTQVIQKEKKALCVTAGRKYVIFIFDILDMFNIVTNCKDDKEHHYIPLP